MIPQCALVRRNRQASTPDTLDTTGLSRRPWSCSTGSASSIMRPARRQCVGPALRSWIALLVVLTATLLAPQMVGAERGECDYRVIGEQEPVEISTPSGSRTVQAVAKVDTGAGRSSIDDELAERLGIDLENAETITIRSTLGEEERPKVNVRLHVADRIIDTEVTVTDRDELTHQALLGNRDLQGFLVDVSREELTTPGDAPVTPCEERFLGTTTTRSEALGLLATIPVAAAVVVAIRTLLGLATFGVFAPVLLAVAFVQTGLVRGLVIFAAILATGLLVQPLLKRLHLPRVARLAVLIAVVAGLVLVMELYLGSLTGGVHAIVFPVVVLAIIIERFWAVWEEEDLRTALKTSAWTLAAAIVSYSILILEPVRAWADQAPIVIVLIGAILAVAFGLYRGLRLREFVRFRQLAIARRSV